MNTPRKQFEDDVWVVFEGRTICRICAPKSTNREEVLRAADRLLPRTKKWKVENTALEECNVVPEHKWHWRLQLGEEREDEIQTGDVRVMSVPPGDFQQQE